MSNSKTSLGRVTTFLRAQLASHEARWSSNHSTPAPPLFVGVQGPQGCGKSYLCTQLPGELVGYKVVALSLDDLYLPHEGLERLAQEQEGNKMLQGRGPAGTHDLGLGRKVLGLLKGINSSALSVDGGEGGEGGTVELPVFDKSLHGGKGDRSKATVRVQGPISIVLLEGWMTGFTPPSLPTTPSHLSTLYPSAQTSPESFAARTGLDYPTPFFLEHSLADLEFVEERLGEYEEALWGVLDCFVLLRPRDLGFTWGWRLEQEHNMKAQNGGIGMTDEQVKSFIARYMPGYELYLDSIEKKSCRWSGKGLKLIIGKDRSVIDEESF